MKEWQLRVMQENVDLNESIEKLTAFKYSEVFASLPSVEQGLMMVQLVAMQNYSDALSRRVDIYHEC